MKIEFNDGLWQLGKNTAVEESEGFKYVDTNVNKNLNEYRYLRPIIFLELFENMSSIYSYSRFSTDRTPYLLRILCEHNLIIPELNFLGRKEAYTNDNLQSTINQMKLLEKVFEDYIVKLSNDHQIIFNIFIPSNWFEYYKKYVYERKEDWYIQKMLKSDQRLTYDNLTSINNELIKSIKLLALKCRKEIGKNDIREKQNNVEVNLKLSKIW